MQKNPNRAQQLTILRIQATQQLKTDLKRNGFSDIEILRREKTKSFQQQVELLVREQAKWR